MMSSSGTVSHDVFHLHPCLNDKRFVAALIAVPSVKPLKQTPERLMEGCQDSEYHSCRQTALRDKSENPFKSPIRTNIHG